MATGKTMRKRATKMRHKLTPSERKTAQILRYLHIPVSKQVILGFYIADFVGKDRNFILEVDGSSHDNKEVYDFNRDKFFKEVGFKVIHIRNEDVSEDKLKSLLEGLGKIDRLKILELIWYAGTLKKYWRRNTVVQTRRQLSITT